MVSRFDWKYTNFLKSFDGLKENLSEQTSDLNRQKAILYDFSGATEQGWKLLKYYLERVNGLEDLGNQSKKIIRAGKDDGLYDETEAERLMEMVDLRNVLLHEYNFEGIERSCERISTFVDTLTTLKDVLSDLKAKYADYWNRDTLDR